MNTRIARNFATHSVLLMKMAHAAGGALLRPSRPSTAVYDLAMDSAIVVRAARIGDVGAMARVHVISWQETYRGLVSDAFLDDPGRLPARERMWTAMLTEDRFAKNRVAVAERDGVVIGIAMSGPAEDADAPSPTELAVLYLLADAHGSGAGAELLDAVIDPYEDAALWVADPNPRAQAFYVKHGFVADGTTRLEGTIRAIRMVRAASPVDAPRAPEQG